jgi:hypothetical protein
MTKTYVSVNEDFLIGFSDSPASNRVFFNPDDLTAVIKLFDSKAIESLLPEREGGGNENKLGTLFTKEKKEGGEKFLRFIIRKCLKANGSVERWRMMRFDKEILAQVMDEISHEDETRLGTGNTELIRRLGTKTSIDFDKPTEVDRGPFSLVRVDERVRQIIVQGIGSVQEVMNLESQKVIDGKIKDYQTYIATDILLTSLNGGCLPRGDEFTEGCLKKILEKSPENPLIGKYMTFIGSRDGDVEKAIKENFPVYPKHGKASIPIDRHTNCLAEYNTRIGVGMANAREKEMRNVHLLRAGFDTLVKLKDEKFYPWQIKGREVISGGESALLVVPTSGGKTFLSITALTDMISRNRTVKGKEKERILYILPTNPLALQVFSNISKTVDVNHAKIALLCDGISHVPEGHTVCVGTPVALLSWLRSRSSVTESLYESAIFDEIHTVALNMGDDKKRSCAIKSLMPFVTKQVICLSATINEEDTEILSSRIKEWCPRRDNTKSNEVKIITPDPTNPADGRNVEARKCSWNGSLFLKGSPVPVPITAEGTYDLIQYCRGYLHSSTNKTTGIETEIEGLERLIIFDETEEETLKNYIDFIHLMNKKTESYHAWYSIQENVKILNEANAINRVVLAQAHIVTEKRDQNRTEKRFSKGHSGASIKDQTDDKKTYVNNCLKLINDLLLDKSITSGERSDLEIEKGLMKKMDVSSRDYVRIPCQSVPHSLRIGKKLEEFEAFKDISKRGRVDELQAEVSTLCAAEGVGIKGTSDILSLVSRGLEFGVGIMIEGFPFAVQIEMMKLLNKGNDGLTILFTSSSMSMGVNFPVQASIIRKKTFSPMSVSTYLQMAGRAGRKGNDDVGYSIGWNVENAHLCVPDSIERIILPEELTLNREEVKILTEDHLDYWGETGLRGYHKSERVRGKLARHLHYGPGRFTQGVRSYSCKSHKVPEDERSILVTFSAQLDDEEPQTLPETKYTLNDDGFYVSLDEVGDVMLDDIFLKNGHLEEEDLVKKFRYHYLHLDRDFLDELLRDFNPRLFMDSYLPPKEQERLLQEIYERVSDDGRTYREVVGSIYGPEVVRKETEKKTRNLEDHVLEVRVNSAAAGVDVKEAISSTSYVSIMSTVALIHDSLYPKNILDKIDILSRMEIILEKVRDQSYLSLDSHAASSRISTLVKVLMELHSRASRCYSLKSLADHLKACMLILHQVSFKQIAVLCK